jgi:uncharacterized protein DUF6894
MKRFFFDLVGEPSAQDVLGHQCKSLKEAKDHAKFIAQRIGTERSALGKPGNCISVRNEAGLKVFEAPIRSATRTHVARAG